MVFKNKKTYVKMFSKILRSLYTLDLAVICRAAVRSEPVSLKFRQKVVEAICNYHCPISFVLLLAN